MKTMDVFKDIWSWNVDIDKYINPYVPRSQLYRFPYPLAYVLGYRKEPTRPLGNIWVKLWSFIGAFVSLVFIAGVTKSSPLLQRHHPPLLFASFGAAAILQFNAIESPLAQPRSSVLGHTLSAIVGVGITKLFALRSDFDSLQWVAGSVACGAASAVMILTKTVHPPGGATALLAAILPNVTKLGWFFVPMVLLDSVLMMVTAMIINNLQRRWPIFWWTPDEVGQRWRRTKGDVESVKNLTHELESQNVRRSSVDVYQEHLPHAIVVTADHVLIPHYHELDPEDFSALYSIQAKMARGLVSWASSDTIHVHR